MTPAHPFEAVATRWLESLGLDLKDFVRVVCDDQDLPDEVRSFAIGAVLYCLAPGDVVPDGAAPMPLGYIDDTLALRIAIEDVIRRCPDRAGAYRERLPGFMETLDADLAAARDLFGDILGPFHDRVSAAGRAGFKGKTADELLGSSVWLDDEVGVAALRLDFKPGDIASAARRVGSLPALFRERLTHRRS